jgi:hypothetical protein
LHGPLAEFEEKAGGVVVGVSVVREKGKEEDEKKTGDY